MFHGAVVRFQEPASLFLKDTSVITKSKTEPPHIRDRDSVGLYHVLSLLVLAKDCRSHAEGTYTEIHVRERSQGAWM